MCGECNWPLEKKDKKGIFYSNGEYFETEEEYWKHVREWSTKKLDEQTARRLLDDLKRNVIVNTFMYKRDLSNDEMRTILENAFLYILEQIAKKNLD